MKKIVKLIEKKVAILVQTPPFRNSRSNKMELHKNIQCKTPRLVDEDLEVPIHLRKNGRTTTLLKLMIKQ